MNEPSRNYNAVTDLVDRHVSAGRGSRIAFVDADGVLSYAGLQARTRRFANVLKALGIHAEQRIALVMQDSVDFPVVFLGAMRASVVPIPLNTMLPVEQIAYVLADCRARALFVSAALYPALAPVLGRLGTLEHVVVVGGAIEQSRGLAELLAAAAPDAPTAPTWPDEPAFWLYSSGSTGSPKGVKHVHSSLMATAATYGRQVLGIREDDVCFSAAKLFFAYGLGNALTFPLAVGATSILYAERPTPAAVFALLKQHAPTLFFAVPTLYAAMLGDPALAAEKGSPRWRLCVSAGEALPEHVGKAWKARFGVDILDGVGSTEMLHIFLSNSPGEIRYGRSGRPVPGYDARLVGEAGHDVADGEVGEMLVRGPSAAEGYWNQRDKSRGTFEGAWTRTGDKYTRDADGVYTYCGRSDDMFMCRASGCRRSKSRARSLPIPPCWRPPSSPPPTRTSLSSQKPMSC